LTGAGWSGLCRPREKKSRLFLEAQLLRAQDRDEAAAALLAEAAQIEEGPSERCFPSL